MTTTLVIMTNTKLTMVRTYVLLVSWMRTSYVSSLVFLQHPSAPTFHCNNMYHRHHPTNHLERSCYYRKGMPFSFSAFFMTEHTEEEGGAVKVHDDDDAGEVLLDWMEDNSSSFVGPLEIKKSSFGHGLGLFVTEDVEGDKILLEIPREKCIALDDSRSDDDGHDNVLNNNNDAVVNDSRNKLAGKLSLEYLKMILHDRLTTTKDDELDVPLSSSEFEPYLRLLPFEVGGQQQHILKWSNEEVDELFRGSIAYDEVRSLRNEVEKAIHILRPQLRSKLDSILGSDATTPHVSTSTNNNLLISDDELTNAITSSFISILSRSFEDDETNGSKLIPVLDMCNHSSSSSSAGGGNIMHGTDTDDGTVVVYTNRSIKAGTELCYMYYDIHTDKKKDDTIMHDGYEKDDDLIDRVGRDQEHEPDDVAQVTTTTLEPYQFFILCGFLPDDAWRDDNPEQQQYTGDVRELLRSKSTVFFS